jgi:hypothetical protein
MNLENCINYPCIDKYCYGCKDRVLKPVKKQPVANDTLHLKDFPTIPCPTCQTSISKPIEWGMIDMEGVVHTDYGVWYHCKKCGDWTIQTLTTAKQLLGAIQL